MNKAIFKHMIMPIKILFRKMRILLVILLLIVHTFVIMRYLSPWIIEETHWTRHDSFHFQQASKMLKNMSDFTHSPLSPGLQWCSSNPFLSTYDRKTVFYLEHIWYEWSQKQLQNVYDILTEVARSPNTTEENIVLMIYPDTKHLPCPDKYGLKRYGKSTDTGKVLCGLSSLAPSVDCIVYSLGSNNHFEFEESIAKRTSCKVYTYDCTSLPPKNPIRNVHFHQVCMGEKTNLQEYMYPNNGTNRHRQNQTYVFKRFSEILKENDHERVHVLKMDIEGAEYAVFADMLNSAREFTLPFQISFESHWWSRDIYHATLHQQMFNQLWKNGYRFLHHEINPNDNSCVEWTLMRVFC
ncbi:unnamed protein product [Adineta ricciae]|uniref:Methyltransferase domain-containing protein n=2 Tax=Adineta ricciae TaxID=249248 RepID=A0A814VEU4_ADIRI|nr:unnamed protein product [Adineta ricciae]